MAVLVNFNASAGNAEESVKATKYSGEIKIDGRLDDKAWENAPFHEIQRKLGGGATEIKTKFKVLYDEYALYVGVVCAETEMEKIKTNAKRRDMGVWKDDCIELFINPNRKLDVYAHFIVNALGTVYDSRGAGTDEQSNWNAQGLEAVSFKGDNHWSFELKIPFCNFYALYPLFDQRKVVSEKGWIMNIVRNKTTQPGGKVTYAALSNFRDAANYAALTGIDINYTKFLWQILNLSGSLKPEQTQLQSTIKASVENKTDKFRVVSIESVMTEIADLSVKNIFSNSLVVEKAIGIDKGQNFAVKFNGLLSKQGQYNVAVLVKAKEHILAWESKDLSLTYSPLKLSVVKPFYRSAIYATMDVRNIMLRIDSDIAGAISPEEKCKVFLKNEKGGIITGQEYPLQASLGKDIELSIPKLAPGEYTCRVEYKNYSAESPLHVYAPSQSEVRFNEHRNLVVNGKEVFPIGSFQNYWGLGFDGNEYINFTITYRPVNDLSANPDYAAALESNEALNRNSMFYPEPKSIWGHQGVDKKHLRTKPLPPENAALIAKHVSQYQNLKGFWGWYLSDEPNPSVQLPEYLERVAATVRKADPYHPCLISFNTENAVDAYRNAFDICGLHNFLFFGFDGAGKKVVDVPILSIAKAVDVAVKQVNNLRPVWLALSTIPYRHVKEARTPDFDEARCMAYLGIVHGAKGIYWNTAFDVAYHLESRIGYPALSKELRALENVFLTPTDLKIKLAGKDAGKVHALGKILDGNLYIFAVNPYPAPIAATIKLSDEWAAKGKLFELAADRRECALTDGTVALQMTPYQVRIFSTDPSSPALPSISSIKARFKTENERLKNMENICYFDRNVNIRLSFDAHNSIEGKRSLADGFMDGYYWWGMKKNKSTDNQEKWVEFSFSKPETLARIEVSWKLRNAKGKTNKAYNFRAQYQDENNQYVDIKDASPSEDFDQASILTKKITFAKVAAKNLKIYLPADVSSDTLPSEIQAFAE